MPITDKTLVGYFINYRMAFSDVDYHLKRMWKRFGVKEITMDDNGFIFINFNNEVNLTDVLHNGPCFIRNVPIFLQQWNPQMVLKKLDQEMVTMIVDSIGVRFPFGPFKELVYTEMDVEYEWKPARCGTCLVFGHDGKSCPKSFGNDEKVVETPALDKDDEKRNPLCRKLLTRCHELLCLRTEL
nr:hypothetical protein [Tanacetum cinerariifolium]